MIITVSTCRPEDPITSLIAQYSQAFEDDDDGLADQAQDEILDLLLEVGWRAFRAVAPAIPQQNRISNLTCTKNLHAELNPETFYFRLVMDQGNAEIVQSDPSTKSGPSYLKLKDGTCNLPRYPSREITVTEKVFGTAGYIAEVLVAGLEMCCKIVTRATVKAVQREYDCLQQIMISRRRTSIPVPKLLGLVVDDDRNIIGILEDLIRNQGRLTDVVEKEAEIFKERKIKWAKQIRQAVALLHETDVVWGDGKPHNVLVDGWDDCFLIDFGGSYTEGWADRTLMDTHAGDDQAVEKIVEYLGILDDEVRSHTDSSSWYMDSLFA